ncbi:MAG: hypothetical protein AAGI30_06980 [Planctomycetota bacterium]
MVVLGLVALAAWVVVFAPGWGVATRAVVPTLSRVLGGEVDAGAVGFTLDGEVMIHDFRWRIPGVPDEAAELMWAERVVVELDLAALSKGQVSPTSIELIDPRVRIVWVDNAPNVLALERRAGPGGGVPSLPDLELPIGTIEIAELTPDGLAVLERIEVEGSVRRHRTGAGGADIHLRQILDGHPTGLRIDGDVDLARNHLELVATDVDLGQIGELRVPSIIRDLWESLGMRGSVTRVAMSYDGESEIAGSIEFENVGVTLPISPREHEPTKLARRRGGVEPFALHQVSGAFAFSNAGVHATMTGLISDLPMEIDLELDGLTLDAPLRIAMSSTGYRLTKAPALIPYTPELVGDILRRFQSPEATVDASIRVSRGPVVAGTETDLSIDGEVRFRDGTVAYEAFDYWFTNARGVIEFDEESVTITDIRGDGPTGARLHATGRISPLDPTARVEIDVNVTRLPTDNFFTTALPAEHRDAVDILFSMEGFRRVKAGLGQAAATGDLEAAHLLRTIEADYLPGGVASLSVAVRRELGPNNPYRSEIEFAVPDAAIVPGPFPYLARAEELRLRIIPGARRGLVKERTRVEVLETALTGLTGMTGTLSGTVTLAAEQTDGTMWGADEPDIRIEARAVPVDQLMLLALPDEPEADEADLSPREIIESLRLDGTVDTWTHITSPHQDSTAPLRPGFNDEFAFTSLVRFEDVTASPGTLGPGRFSGTLEVTQHLIRTPDDTPITGELGGAPLHAEATVLYNPPEVGLGASTRGGERIDASVRARALDLTKPLEELVEVFSLDAAEKLRELRDLYEPSGHLSTDIRIAGPIAEPSVDLDLFDLDDLSFSAMDGRMSLERPSGTIAVRGDMIVFDEFFAGVDFDGERVGDVVITGQASAKDDDTTMDLELHLQNTRLEAALTGRVIRDTFSTGGLDPALYDESAPTGLVDARFHVRRAPGQTTPTFTGRIEPTRAEITRLGERLAFHQITGAIVLNEGGGGFESLTLRSDAIDLTLGGEWQASERTGADLALTIDANAPSLTPGARALVPPEVREILSGLDIEVEGPVEAVGVTIETPEPDWAGISALRVAGTLHVDGLAMNAGAPVEEAGGTIRFAIDAPVGDGENDESLPVSFELRAELDALRYAGLLIENAVIEAEEGRTATQTLLPRITGSVYNGRLSASGAVDAASTPTDEAFEIHAEFDRVDFARMLHDLGAIEGPEPASQDRGLLAGNLSVGGRLTDLNHHLGRGTLRIQDGDILDTPGIIPLLTLSNLQIPSGNVPDLAYAEFYIRGEELVAPTIVVSETAAPGELVGGNFTIEGAGSIQWPTSELDLTFTTRGRRQIPMVSNFIQGIRDEIVTTRITGPIDDPQLTYEQLSNTKRFLASIFGSDDDTDVPRPPGARDAGAREGGRWQRQPTSQQPSEGRTDSSQ